MTRSPLIAALRLRKLTLTHIARMIHPDRGPELTDEAVRSYLPHLSRHINGHEPIHRNIRGTKVLNPTWRSLKRVLTGAEFDAALEFAEKKSAMPEQPQRPQSAAEQNPPRISASSAVEQCS